MLENKGYTPSQVVAGETIWLSADNTIQEKSDLIFSDYTPAGGYTLAYQFNTATPISVAGVSNPGGTGWTLIVTAAQTLLWGAGTINFVGVVTHTASARVFAVDAGCISVIASPLTVSQYAAALTAIEAAIAGFATSPQRSFSLGDMSISFGGLSELLDLRAYYKDLIARETGRQSRRIIRTRFT